MACAHPDRDIRNAKTGERICRDCGVVFPPESRAEAVSSPAAPSVPGCAHANTHLRNAATGERVCASCGWVLPKGSE
jgi:transcription initiation factor TFIIIB Brf1 subunit/transcription initiation factor TFIIB